MIKLSLVLELARWTTNVRFFHGLIASQVRIPTRKITREKEKGKKCGMNLESLGTSHYLSPKSLRGSHRRNEGVSVVARAE